MNDLSPMHITLLNMLKWFHEKCIEMDLNYYAVGGTMLGIIRHKGFIPWDDDVDVAMPRRDYDIFVKKFSVETSDKYVVEVPSQNNKDFPYIYAKLYDTETLLIEHTRYQLKRGIYIDIFPLDGIGDTQEEAIKNYSSIFKYIRLHDAIVCAYRKQRSWFKNFSVLIGRIISPTFISERWLNNYISLRCQKRDFYKSRYVGNLVGNWGYKELMSRSFFGSPVIYKFEGIDIYGVAEPENYLSSLYGDYLTPPPIEKQKSHHDYVELNLNKSYK